MTQAPPQSFRIKIPCADERDFREHFAQKYVTSGIFVPSKNPRPVGTRVRIKLEIRSGQVLVSGDAMVTSRTPEGAGRPGMTMRITALHPDSLQFELSRAAFVAAASAGAAPAVTPPAGGTALDHLFDPEEEPAPVEPSGPDDTLEFSEVEPTPQPAPTPLPAAAAGTAPVATGPAAIPIARIPAPVVATEPAPKRPAEPRRIAIWIAAGVAIVAAIAAVAVVSTVRIARPRPQGSAADARVVAELRIADARLLDGRLADSGGDSALDHLLLAKAAAPGDPRVTSRLRLLGDKFEELGDRALARRNLREAEVHFAAALRADPGREGARRKLAEIAAAEPDGVAPPR